MSNHRPVNGCLCFHCWKKDIDVRDYPTCATPGCDIYVTTTSYYCCVHYNRKWGHTPCSCGCTERINMASNDVTKDHHKFLVYTNGNLQYTVDTIEQAKERAQELIRNKNTKIFIYEAILKVAPKPLEVDETDLRVPEPTATK
jgi:hypothetical protein